MEGGTKSRSCQAGDAAYTGKMDRRLYASLSLLLLWLLAMPLLARETITVAKDITVVSAEFGAFPFQKGPQTLRGRKVVFSPTNDVNKIGFSYGWRIKLKTPRRAVRVYEVWNGAKQGTGEGEDVQIVDGYIYHDWDVVMGTRKGKHTVEVFIEGVPVKTFAYFVH